MDLSPGGRALPRSGPANRALRRMTTPVPAAAEVGFTKLLTGAPGGGKRAPRDGGATLSRVKESRLAKTDLGAKQVCPNCGAKFYDLGRRPAVCPKCTTSFNPDEEGVKARRTRARAAAHDPAYDDDEEVNAKGKAKGEADDDEDEDEIEETPEIDAEAEADPVVVDDDEDEDAKPAGDDLPEGFSEDDGEIGDAAGEDDGVPMLEDEEEFNEDELGDLPGGDEDESR